MLYCFEIIGIFLREDERSDNPARPKPVEKFVLFPNPADNKLYIRYKNKADYEILDLSGKTVAQGSVDHNASIEIKELNPGMYFIKLLDGNNVGIKKFVKL